MFVLHNTHPTYSLVLSCPLYIYNYSCIIIISYIMNVVIEGSEGGYCTILVMIHDLLHSLCIPFRVHITPFIGQLEGTVSGYSVEGG